jgi:hypothetical protein
LFDDSYSSFWQNHFGGEIYSACFCILNAFHILSVLSAAGMLGILSRTVQPKFALITPSAIAGPLLIATPSVNAGPSLIVTHHRWTTQWTLKIEKRTMRVWLVMAAMHVGTSNRCFLYAMAESRQSEQMQFICDIHQTNSKTNMSTSWAQGYAGTKLPQHPPT